MKRFLFILFLAGSFCLPTFTSAADKIGHRSPSASIAVWSLKGNRILALDQRGVLLLIKANLKEFDLIGEMKISDADTWAHLPV